MIAPYPLRFVGNACQGASLVALLITLLLCSVGSLSLLRYIDTLQSSEQILWQQREAWHQLAQRLEGSERESASIREQEIASANGCRWQQVAWLSPHRSPLILQRLRCP